MTYVKPDYRVWLIWSRCFNYACLLVGGWTSHNFFFLQISAKSWLMHNKSDEFFFCKVLKFRYYRIFQFLFFELWSFLYSKYGRFSLNFHHNLKMYFFRFSFRMFLNYWDQKIKMTLFERGRICKSFSRKYPYFIV